MSQFSEQELVKTVDCVLIDKKILIIDHCKTHKNRSSSDAKNREK